jgi:hypothetical protein
MPRLANPPRIGQAVPAQQPWQIGPAVGVEGHQLAVHERPCRQTAQNFQFRIASRATSLGTFEPFCSWAAWRNRSCARRLVRYSLSKFRQRGRRGDQPPIGVPCDTCCSNCSSLFQQTDGWIGADGAHSVTLSPKKTLWLFSDTWVGKVRDGRRTNATIVNNTVGVQEGSSGRVTYTIAHGPDGKPTALIVPVDKRGWFWLQAGAADRGHR